MTTEEIAGALLTVSEPLTPDERAAMADFLRTMRTVKQKPAPQHLPACGADKIAAGDEIGCVYECPVWQALEKERTRLTTGKWTCSTNEENFDCHEMLDAEAEAIEYGKIFCEEMGVEDGELYYTGQIKAITADEMAAGSPGAERIVESIEEHLYDVLGDISEGGLSVKPDAIDDLDERIQACVERWIVDHDLVPNWCHIEHTKSHVFHQCDMVDESQGGPSSTARCTRHAGHDGEHDFP
jgi:hypothetical protein